MSEVVDYQSQADLLRAEELRQRKRKLLATPLVVLLLAGGAYLSMTRGCESKHLRFDGGFVGGDSGMESGGRTLLAFGGQKITVDYDVKQIDRGRFSIRIGRTTAKFDPDKVNVRYVRTTGPGTYQLTVPETGMYFVRCGGMPDGNGYDLTYSASWRVH